jgi:hypothetical protein
VQDGLLAVQERQNASKGHQSVTLARCGVMVAVSCLRRVVLLSVLAVTDVSFLSRF